MMYFELNAGKVPYAVLLISFINGSLCDIFACSIAALS